MDVTGSSGTQQRQGTRTQCTPAHRRLLHPQAVGKVGDRALAHRMRQWSGHPPQNPFQDQRAASKQQSQDHRLSIEGGGLLPLPSQRTTEI